MVMGRRRKEFSKDQFEYLCALQCTETEVAAFFGMGVTALVERVKETYEGKTFQEVRPGLAEVGKVSLRRIQFKHAQKSARMAEFLGTQMLDQKPPAREQINIKSDTHVHTEDGTATVHIHPVESQQVRSEPGAVVVAPKPAANTNGNGAHQHAP